MQIKSTLKERAVENKETLIGIFFYSGDTSIAEAASVAGIDFLVVDMEASAMPEKSALNVMQTLSGSSCSPIVRVAEHNKHLIEHSLDLGASGIMVPRVDTSSEAHFVSSPCHYPPRGNRGLNALRASAYALNETEYLETANSQSLCIVQIESPDGVENADAIASVSNIDCLFVGSGDLALSYSLAGQIHHPVICNARSQVIKACHNTGKVPGIFAGSLQAAQTFIDEGFRLIAIGNEIKHFLSSVTSHIEVLKH